MARAVNKPAHPDAVELVRGPDRGNGHYWCMRCRTLQAHHRELSVSGVPCVACGELVGALDRVEFATLRARLTAFSIDLACAAAFYTVVDYIFFPYSIYVAVGAILYITLGDVFGVSLGRFVAGIRVVRRATLRAPGPVFGLLRALAKVLTIGTAGLGYVLMLKDPERRALHDVISGTRVIYREARTAVGGYV